MTSTYTKIAVLSVQAAAFFILLLALVSIGAIPLGAKIAAAAAFFLYVCLVFPVFSRGMDAWLAACGAEIEAWVRGASSPAVRTAIIVAAALTLFLELVLIRWEASFFPVFSLYKNLPLLSCFCGLGIGYALTRDTRLLLGASLPMLAALLLIFSLLRYGLPFAGLGYLQVVPVREESAVVFSLQDFSVAEQLRMSMPVYALLALTFILNVLVLLPAGQFCGRLMQRAQPLASYGYNLLGSVAGVGLLFFLSWMWTGPVIWFGLAAAVLAHYLMAAPSARRVALWSAAVCVLVAGWPVSPMTPTLYSPYQLIEQATQKNGMLGILASGSYFQKIYDLGLSNANRDATPRFRKVVGYYDLPFKTAEGLGHVAIVGAGTGNDVAAALRNGAGSVDAVEIDPAIRDLGVNNHPERPYQDKRTHSIIDDARSFFRKTRGEYDAIVYGVLDSHVVVSHGGNMRVDSFVYTQEGLKDAFVHLRKGGLLSVSFALPNHLMGEKVFRILRTLPGASPPVAVLTGYDNKDTTTFMVSRGGKVTLPAKFMAAHQLAEVTKDYEASSGAALDLPTDDWPFFYMNKKMYPATYVVSLALMLALAFLLVRAFLPARRLEAAMLPFFFLGSGFMLVETKAITELSLLFGNTWQVVGVTIISVLIMAFFANLLASRLGRGVAAPAFAGLLLIIAAGYWVVTSGGGIGMPDLAGKIAMVALLTSPLFFSGLVFSTLLGKTADLCGAMAYNLMGAMLGGVLEYNAMQFGFASLYLIALALYGLAWLATGAGKARSA